MLCVALASLLLAGAEPVSRPHGEPPPAQAYEHLLRAELALAANDKAEAVRELRYALIFDHESRYVRARLAALLGVAPRAVATASNRLRLRLSKRVLQDTAQLSRGTSRDVAQSPTK